ncbi:MAG: STAS domain-containing protein [Verrucomicrobia bacterium]|nr:STAS domain-containing protein [Verrucomicrobiota bacterium]
MARKTVFEVIEETDALTHVKLAGRLDIAGVDEIELAFTSTVYTRGKSTIVDVSGISFLASMGIRLLAGAARSLAKHGAKIVLYRPPTVVRECIERSALDDMILLVANEQEARTRVGA